MKKLLLSLLCILFLLSCKEYKAKKLIYSNLYIGNLDSVFSNYTQDEVYQNYAESLSDIQKNKNYLVYKKMENKSQDTLLKEIYYIKSQQVLDNLGYNRFIDTIDSVRNYYKPEFLGYKLLIGLENKTMILYFDKNIKEIIALDCY